MVCDKGLSGTDSKQFFADLDLLLIRPARKDEKILRPFPNWLHQRIKAIIWTLKHQLGLEEHRARVPQGLWARVVQRLLALNAVIWHNWNIGAPVKRSLSVYESLTTSSPPRNFRLSRKYRRRPRVRRTVITSVGVTTWSVAR